VQSLLIVSLSHKIKKILKTYSKRNGILAYVDKFASMLRVYFNAGDLEVGV